MFAYLRSHHKRGSQPNSPVSSTAPEGRPAPRIDCAGSSQLSDIDVDKLLKSKTNPQNSPVTLLSRHNQYEERIPVHDSNQYLGSDQGIGQGTIYQAQSIALVRSIPSMENIRPATSQQSRTGHTLSDLSRPSTSYVRPYTRPTTCANTDSQMSCQIPSERLADGSKFAHGHSISQPVKSTKNKLSLLKPISLLTRRKTGQPSEQLSEENLARHKTLSVPAMKFPDDYDPSIRGKVIHDFNAPRPRKNYSSQSMTTESYEIATDVSTGTLNTCENVEKVSRSRNFDRLHMPVFVEHFDDDDGKSEEYQAAVQAERLADKDFISRNVLSGQSIAMKPTFEVGMLRGAFPARIDSLKPRSGAALKLVETLEASPGSSTPCEELSEASDSEAEGMTSSEKHTSSTDQSTSIPSRWASKASRFSFQTGGSDSAAQERLLEERHKQKAAAQGLTDAVMDMVLLDENEDADDAYDNMYDEGGYLEEQIPGVNADLNDDDEFLNGTIASAGIAEMSFDTHQTAKASESFPTNTEAQLDTQSNFKAIDIPLINFGEHIGALADIEETTLSLNAEKSCAKPTETTASKVFNDINSDTRFSVSEPTIDERSPINKSAENDDLYFDDGAIEDVNGPEEVSFNESILDNFEQKMPDIETKSINTNDNNDYQSGQLVKPIDNSPRSRAVLPPRTNSLQMKANASDASGVTIDAYYSALADAANRAVADGKFERRDSLDATDAYDADLDQATPCETMNGSVGEMLSVNPEEMLNEDNSFADERFGQYFRGTAYYDGYTNACYDYDSDADEDDIVAEANAEALANDDDGFYGQEFGFYAHAFGNGGEEEQAANGGFFGPSGLDGLGRSASGRNAVREPNLTPITERSEYSARNSYVTLLNAGISPASLAASGHLAASLATAPSSATHSSPNLSLTHSIHPYGFEQDDMTMSQLLRIRRGAFGGSSSSLKSGDTSGSSSGLGSVNGGPAANPSPVLATAAVSSLSLSNSGSSSSSQIGPLYLDSQHRAVSGSNVTAAATHTTAFNASESTAVAVEDNTCSLGQSSIIQDRAYGDNRFSYEDNDSSALESPTLTAITCTDSGTFTTNEPAITLITTFPTSPEIPCSSHPQTQGESESRLPRTYSLMPATHFVPTNVTSTDNPLQPLAVHHTPSTAANSISTVAESVLQQPSPSSIVVNSFTDPSSDIHSQQFSFNSKSIIDDSTGTDRKRDLNHIDKNVVKPFVKTHGRNGSSTDSISVAYVRERDPNGADRWVLERRRTAENGRMELVEREVISEGRI